MVRATVLIVFLCGSATAEDLGQTDAVRIEVAVKYTVWGQPYRDRNIDIEKTLSAMFEAQLRSALEKLGIVTLPTADVILRLDTEYEHRGSSLVSLRLLRPTGDVKQPFDVIWESVDKRISYRELRKSGTSPPPARDPADLIRADIDFAELIRRGVEYDRSDNLSVRIQERINAFKSAVESHRSIVTRPE